MSLNVDDFEVVFGLLNAGHPPFAWQRRLLDSVVGTGRWPDVVAAPTGAGKSNVVDVHVFANALSAVRAGPRVPRRLSVVVNRRALVDRYHERAQLIAQALRSPRSEILRRVAEALSSLSLGGPPLVVSSVRGGLAAQQEWIDDPRVPVVLSATPDMWGSRLLFRGYGTSRYARPREAGLLALDSVVVLDEAHLNRQLAHTARDVARLVGREAPAGLGEVPSLQVVATTATPDPTDVGTTVGVTDADLVGRDEPLRRRLTAPKFLSVVPTTYAPAKGPATAKYADFLAARAQQVSAAVDGPLGVPATVLCVVNHVETAVALTERLRKAAGGDRVECWVGRMRGMDLTKLRVRRPGLLTVEGDDEVGYLVATQTVEVGIDIDCAALVTELAPGSALVQRLGRVNRRGVRRSATVDVVVPDGEISADRPPYFADDLRAARVWLDMVGDGGDVSPWALRHHPAPQESTRRLARSDLYDEHAELLGQTSDELFEEPDLDFWLRDDLDPAHEPAGFVLRDEMPYDDNVAMALLRATPPDDDEVFPSTVRTAASLVEAILTGREAARAFCWRAGELIQLRPEDPADARVRPGDQVVLDAGHSLTRQGVVVESPPVRAENHDTVWGGEEITVVLDSNDENGLLTELAGCDPEAAQELFEVLTGRTDKQVVIPPDGLLNFRGRLPWVVLRYVAAADLDPETRQEWTRTTGQPVTLAIHRAAVAERAEQVALSLGLPPETVAAMRLAGLHHDDGKADKEFQALLRGTTGTSARDEPLLAKSTLRSAQQTQARRPRPGWRHEQLSAVHAWLLVPAGPTRDLVTRLAGTSHGRGRPFFPQGAASLLDGRYDGDLKAVAYELFDTGAGWSEVLDRTHARYGVWGCAYLEAVVRAADCQVSREGS